jgi:hypothetical protein
VHEFDATFTSCRRSTTSSAHLACPSHVNGPNTCTRVAPTLPDAECLHTTIAQQLITQTTSLPCHHQPHTTSQHSIAQANRLTKQRRDSDLNYLYVLRLARTILGGTHKSRQPSGPHTSSIQRPLAQLLRPSLLHATSWFPNKRLTPCVRRATTGRSLLVTVADRIRKLWGSHVAW